MAFGESGDAGFDLVEHTADIGFNAWGLSPAETLRQAVRALAFIAFDGPPPETPVARVITVAGIDWPDVLVNFLSEVLYLFDAGHFATVDCRIDLASPTSVVATLFGQPRDARRQPWKLIVKAVTYHDLVMEGHDHGWRARVILDV